MKFSSCFGFDPLAKLENEIDSVPVLMSYGCNEQQLLFCIFQNNDRHFHDETRKNIRLQMN